MRYLLFLPLAISLLLTGCIGTPKGITPVGHFDLQKYLGRWYEIARLDHSFERGLTRVTATYSLRPDGGIKVVNRGYSPEQNRWKQAIGKAYFVKSPKLGYLKVSFFGPFYAAYVVFDIDKPHYHYALVTGPDKSYLWILSRRPTISKTLLDKLIAKANAAGFDTHKLVLVKQNGPQKE